MSRFRICRLSFLFIVVTLFGCTATAQSNEWTWVGGNSTAGSLGSYGSLGVPAASNSPGERTLPCTWADKQGNFWLFGGNGFDSVGTGGYLNDMWKYDPTNRLWTWMGGANVLQSIIAPGTYGAQGQPASGNIPPGRTSPACWTDTKGNLWLFGGFGYVPVLTYYNDLWEFNPVTNQWTWVNGNSTPNQSGVYGTLGSAAAVNAPGGRAYAASWADGQGNLWLFGGFGYDASQTQVGLNDLWEYDTSSNQWTWQSGSSTGGQASVPGTLKTAAAGNVPGARNLASAWTDNSGNLWLFGGAGGLNDLWEFNPASRMWTWMSGNAATPTIGQTQTGSYGVLQTPDPANVPGSRVGSTAWTDRSGNLCPVKLPKTGLSGQFMETLARLGAPHLSTAKRSAIHEAMNSNSPRTQQNTPRVQIKLIG
jgi:hypothetical protein